MQIHKTYMVSLSLKRLLPVTERWQISCYGYIVFTWSIQKAISGMDFLSGKGTSALDNQHTE